MIHPWRDIPPGPHPPELVTAVIEIPRGSRNKYELDKETGMLKLDRVLYSAVHYPGDYGFIPRTLHEDGDPMDILVRINEPTFPGCLIDARPIGVLRMLDKGAPDDKVLAVPRPVPLRLQRHLAAPAALPEGGGALLSHLQGPGGPPGPDHRMGERGVGVWDHPGIDSTIRGEVPEYRTVTARDERQRTRCGGGGTSDRSASCLLPRTSSLGFRPQA